MKILDYILIIIALLIALFACYNWYDSNQTAKQINEDKQVSDSLAVELGKLLERIKSEAETSNRTITEITVIKQNRKKIPEKIKALTASEKTKLLHEKLKSEAENQGEKRGTNW